MKNFFWGKPIFLITLVFFALFFYILYNETWEKNVTITINDATIVKLGEKIPTTLIESHFISSANTIRVDDDELTMFPNDTSLYKYLTIYTFDKKVQLFRVHYDSSSKSRIKIVFQNQGDTIEIDNIESNYYNKIYNGYLVSLKKCNGESIFTIININIVNKKELIF